MMLNGNFTVKVSYSVGNNMRMLSMPLSFRLFKEARIIIKLQLLLSH